MTRLICVLLGLSLAGCVTPISLSFKNVKRPVLLGCVTEVGGDINCSQKEGAVFKKSISNTRSSSRKTWEKAEILSLYANEELRSRPKSYVRLEELKLKAFNLNVLYIIETNSNTIEVTGDFKELKGVASEK